jgi:uncharacterized coiled-coil protein SlyX
MLHGEPMIDREALRRDIELHREAIARRQIELDYCHEAVTKTQPVTKTAEPAAGIPDEWLDVVAIALGETRNELLDELDAVIARVAKIEGQLTTLTSLLEARKKSVRAPHAVEPPKPPQLRLAKP